MSVASFSFRAFALMLEQSSSNLLWDTCGNTITIAQNQAVVFVKLLNSRLLVSVVCWRLGELLFMYMHDVAYTRLLHFFFRSGIQCYVSRHFFCFDAGV